jgi:Protein NO VEIN, C-terminal
MATTPEKVIQSQRTLFARIGWMKSYGGPVPGDERPIGGGDYNRTEIGHEVYNFQEAEGYLYGYFQPTMAANTVALERIDPQAKGKDSLDHVLLVLVARHPEGGQVIVGWYGDAEVSRERIERSPGKPPGYGHFCTALPHNCVLLPEGKRSFEIPSGKGGIGQSNVCYPLEVNGSPKQASWIRQALDFIEDYNGGNILADPELAAQEDSAAIVEEALARSKGQGFARTPQERRALENHAMDVAKKYFKKKGFDVDDVSARRPYDLLCKRGTTEYHVEVKGTTTSGETIVLTNNEVKHACNPRNFCVLFVLHSIQLDEGKPSGGKQLVLDPWQPHQDCLTPVNYTYRLG